MQPCDAMETAGCTHAATDGRRHETCRYVGMENGGPKDELTHEAHWASVGWRDPCSASECQVCTTIVSMSCSCSLHFAIYSILLILLSILLLESEFTCCLPATL